MKNKLMKMKYSLENVQLYKTSVDEFVTCTGEKMVK